MEWLNSYWSHLFLPVLVLALAWLLFRGHARHVAFEENSVTPAATAERRLAVYVQSRKRGLIRYWLGLAVVLGYLALKPRWYT